MGYANQWFQGGEEAAGLTLLEEGGVTSAAGFRAGGVHAGFRANPEKLDLALVVADEPCAAAAVFTQNVFCSPPVMVSRQHLAESGGVVRAVVVNSKVANAATGDEGMRRAQEMAAITAECVGCTEDEVLVASTGVIGVQLPLENFVTGVPAAMADLGSDDAAALRAARAIMTTDTQPKSCAVTFSGDGFGFPGEKFTVGGMAKGSGMIMPNMATMIAVLTTDAPVATPDLQAALRAAVAVSFNKVTVDSDTSTNDTCILLSSGAAPGGAQTGDFAEFTPGHAAFTAALSAVCSTLARAMAADGEGATRLVTVRVEGAATPEDADAAARTVANSPLVKTAIFGNDANWGRIAAALGRSGARFAKEGVNISIMGIPVCAGGMALDFDEDEALRRFEQPEIAIDIDLGSGECATTVWTCDLTHDYVTINGDYRT